MTASTPTGTEKTWAELIRPGKIHNIPANLRPNKIPDKPAPKRRRSRKKR